VGSPEGAGQTVCFECHKDASPDIYAPEPEIALPPLYSTDSHANKPTNACNTNHSESAVAPPRGLDNDGDGFYDTADADCSTTPTLRSTWGRLKILYR
jgi:hypothetical protein